MALKPYKGIHSVTNEYREKEKTDERKTVLINNNNIVKTTKINRRNYLSKVGTTLVTRRKRVTQVSGWGNSQCNYLYCVNSATTMATYYTQYQIPQPYNFPGIVTEWSPTVNTLQVPNFYTAPYAQQIPVAIITPQLIAPLCPYSGALVAAEPIFTSVVHNAVVPERIPALCTNFYTHAYRPEVTYNQEPRTKITEVFNDEDTAQELALPEQAAAIIDESKKVDPIEFYLTLPKELFPKPRMLAIDPNPIIDEFCKIVNINENVPWILDLEFGVPRVPVTRAIAVYDVKFNSIHCKNTPSAIHPGFEKCNNDFKRVIPFYYDFIVSNWYKGYIIMNYDKSVENFQSWLLKPMQIFGMCWP